jgi:hypothetical protein
MPAPKPDAFDSYPRPVRWAVQLIALIVAVWLVSIVAGPIQTLTTPRATPRAVPGIAQPSTPPVPPSEACIEATANEAWAEITSSCRGYSEELSAMWLSEKGRALGEHALVGDQISYCTEHQENSTWLCTSWDGYFPSGKPPAPTAL